MLIQNDDTLHKTTDAVGVQDHYIIVSANGVTDESGTPISEYKGIKFDKSELKNLWAPVNFIGKGNTDHPKVNKVALKTASNSGTSRLISPDGVQPIEKDKISNMGSYDQFVWVKIFGENNGKKFESTDWKFWDNFSNPELAVQFMIKSVLSGLYFCTKNYPGLLFDRVIQNKR